MTQQKTHRTFICSVLFLDIVEYSKKPVVEQIKLKDRFNALLTEALKNIAVNDRIILDTGDGAAIGFLGDPEDALFVAMGFRDSVADDQPDALPQLSIRMGINLGPVKLVTDINKQLNLIGDGINVGQRIMSFAEPGQLLVSRSYYDVISCLSQEYARLFNYQGLHSDKHIREHEIYSVGHQELKLKPRPEAPSRQNVVIETAEAVAEEDIQSDQSRSAVTEASEPGDKTVSPLAKHKKWLYAAAPLAVLVIVIITFSMRGGKSGPTESYSTPVKVITIPQSQTAATHAVTSGAKGSEGASSNAPTEASDQPSSIQFKILPWGEIYVNGKKRGTSPPLTNVKLKPGKYEIEVKNSSFASYTKSVELKPHEKVRIDYKFR